MEKTGAHCSVDLPGYPHEGKFEAIVDKLPSFRPKSVDFLVIAANNLLQALAFIFEGIHPAHR
ncbi:hypothetical protein [Salinicola sp. NYA28a]|jgi:hypothetical protein|nr:hypothetical protein BC443_08675 [Salinicola sp. MIT1003]